MHLTYIICIATTCVWRKPTTHYYPDEWKHNINIAHCTRCRLHVPTGRSATIRRLHFVGAVQQTAVEEHVCIATADKDEAATVATDRWSAYAMRACLRLCAVCTDEHTRTHPVGWVRERQQQQMRCTFTTQIFRQRSERRDVGRDFSADIHTNPHREPQMIFSPTSKNIPNIADETRRHRTSLPVRVIVPWDQRADCEKRQRSPEHSGRFCFRYTILCGLCGLSEWYFHTFGAMIVSVWVFPSGSRCGCTIITTDYAAGFIAKHCRLGWREARTSKLLRKYFSKTGLTEPRYFQTQERYFPS